LPSALRRSTILAGVLWFCVLAKLIFYSSFVPLWEGYDEFAHFAFVEYLFNNHSLPDLRHAVVPPDIAASLQAGPVPSTISNWTGSVSYDDFRQGHRPAARPPADQRLYEAQQPPLAYLLYAIPYAAFHSAALPTRVWIVRITGSLIVSLVVPVGFLLARRVFGDTAHALGAIAIVASMPELMMTADHGGNEPLAILLGTACVFALVSRRALLLGCLVGLGLLTKAYFLTLIPVVAVVFFRQKRQMLIAFATAVVIASWWYMRAIFITGSLTGTQFSGVTTRSLTGINWPGVADFALISHIWLGGWSFLVVRTWMYRAVELIMLAAAIGIVIQLARRRLSEPVAICAGTLLSFIAGMAYFAYATWRATGDAAVFGYYAYALVVPEAICLVAGLTTRFVVPAVVTLFAAIELYGTVFFLMPYYAGITAHTARGSVPAGRISQILSAELFRNLAVNKPDFLSSGVLIALWIIFLAALAAIVAVGFYSAASRGAEEKLR
jgi:hypothetical protein